MMEVGLSSFDVVHWVWFGRAATRPHHQRREALARRDAGETLMDYCEDLRCQPSDDYEAARLNADPNRVSSPSMPFGLSRAKSPYHRSHRIVRL
jgi:hypothetical protein